MADTLYTLTDLIKINDANAKDLGMSDILRDVPLLAALPAVPASNGTQHKYIKETTAPSVGFRAINGGLARTASGDTLITVDLKYLDADHIADVALAAGYKGGITGLLNRMLPRNVGQALYAFEQQILNGGGDGFDGFKQALNALSNGMVINATGSTVGGTTSIYAIRTGELDVSAVFGNDGRIDVLDTVITSEVDGSGNTFSAHRTPIGGWGTIQVGRAKSIGRICNLTTQAGKGASDTLVSQLWNKFPPGRKPDLLVMNSQSIGQIQAGRTATSPTGQEAPYPTEIHGMKIIVTDAILNNEAVVS